MTFIDPNITFSHQMCDIAVGGFIGATAVGAFILSFISKLGLIIVGIYAIKKGVDLIIFFNSKNKVKRDDR